MSAEPSALNASLEATFAEVADVLNAKHEVRAKIRESADAADLVVRAAQRSLGALHTSPSISAPASAGIALVADAGRALKTVEDACPTTPGALREFRHIWEGPLQRSAFVAVFIHFVLEDALASRERVAEMLAADVTLPVEDYLWAICEAVSELPRLARNRVTLGDYETARRNTQFAQNVQDAFGRVNFRNDFLRKKFDGLKYHVNQLEQLIFDLSVRGLLKSGVGEAEGAEKVDEAMPQ